MKRELVLKISLILTISLALLISGCATGKSLNDMNREVAEYLGTEEKPFTFTVLTAEEHYAKFFGTKCQGKVGCYDRKGNIFVLESGIRVDVAYHELIHHNGIIDEVVTNSITQMLMN